MADLITRILFEDKQFNDNIQKSKQQIASFNKKMDVVKAGVTKFAGALGIATTAGAAFKKIIESSDSLSDNFSNTINAAKTSVDQFFKSLATGDFSNFTNGLDEVYRKAWATQAALDRLGDTKLSFEGVSADVRSEISAAQADAHDSELKPAERYKAIERWSAAISKIGNASEVVKGKINDVLQTTLSTFSELKAEDIDFSTVKGVLDLSTMTNEDEIRDQADRDFKLYQKEREKIMKNNSVWVSEGINRTGTYGNMILSDEGKRLLEETAKKYKEAILVRSIWEKMGDDERKNIQSLRVQYKNLDQAVSDYEKTLNRKIPQLEKQIEKQSKGSGGKAMDAVAEGSIAEIEKKIKEAQKTFNNATTDQARAAADALITDLQKRKVQLEVEYKFSNIQNVPNVTIPVLNAPGKMGAIQEVTRLNAELDNAKEKLENTFDAAGVKKLNTEISNLKESIKLISEAHGLTISNAVLGENDNSGLDGYSDALSKVANQNRDAVDSFYAISDAMNAVGSVIGDGAGSWLQWGATVLSAVGQAIPAIAALTAVQETENTVNAKGAMIKGSNSVASIPVVGPIMAVAAIASIAAAFASMPTFTYGGIMPGNLFSGDKMLARVNSGEMILNSGQQSNLFNLLNAGGLSHGNVHVTGELKLRNRTLVAALKQEGIASSRI